MTHILRDVGLDGSLSIVCVEQDEGIELLMLARHFPHILSSSVLGDDFFYKVDFVRAGVRNFLRENAIPGINR